MAQLTTNPSFSTGGIGGAVSGGVNAIGGALPVGNPLDQGLTNTANQPAHKGWHLVDFLDGSVGIAQWTGSQWDWGSLTPPTSTITNFSYLGSSISDIAHNPSRFTTAIAGESSKLQTALISVLDHGVLGLSGQPVLFNKNAKPVGNSGQTGSEANPINQIPSPIDPNAGNSKLNIPSLSALFGSLGLWKGIGLILAGAAILVFAAIEFKNMAGVSVPVPKV